MSKTSNGLPVKYQEQHEAVVDLPALREEFLYAVERRDSNIYRRQRLNYNTRYCVWANQTTDGKKWAAAKGKDVFPWPGASDSRPGLVDMFLREDAAKLMVVWKRNLIQATPTESNDTALATRLTQVLRWMKYTQMTESRRQTKLLANWMLERGTAVMGVFWERRNQLCYEELDHEEVLNYVQTVVQENPSSPMADFPRYLYDPSKEKDAAALAQMAYPDVSLTTLRKAVRDLRTEGKARFPRPVLIRNRPTEVALAMNEHVFVPCETTDLQEARVIFRRELLTEAKLRERVTSNDWNEHWVEQMIKTQRGRLTCDFDGNVFRQSAAANGMGRGILNMSRLFEVIHATQVLSDENGVPGIYYTCFSPGLTRKQDGYAYHELLNYDHGEQPYTLFERECRSELVDDSRGYGEVAATWQQQIKVEWDSRTDRASIAQLPPSFHPEGSPPAAWGPGVQIPVNRPDQFGFLPAPAHDSGSEEVEASVFKWARQYFGRTLPDGENAQEAAALTQEMADNWMDGHGKVCTQELKLMQQFMPDQFYYRVVGTSKARPIHATREEIQGQFDVSISFSMENLDPNKVKEKMALIETAIQMDTQGQVDRSEALVVAFEMIDPNMAERLIIPAEQAAAKEVEDEKTVFAQMFSGVGVDVKPGQNYKLRLDTLEKIMQTNRQAQVMYRKNEFFRELIDTRMKQLAFQTQQMEVNADTGRKGAPSMTPEGLSREMQGQPGISMPATGGQPQMGQGQNY